MFKELRKLRSNLIVDWPVTALKTVKMAHDSGSRDPKKIKGNYCWNGFADNMAPETLVVFDDVLTTGSHFRAFSDFIRENGFKGKVRGIFWARCV